MNVSLTESSDYAYSISVVWSMCKLRMSEKKYLSRDLAESELFFY